MNTETIPDVPRRRAMSWRSYFVRCLLWLVPMWLVMTIFGHFCFLGRDVQIGETSTPWHWFLAVRGVPEPIVKGQLVAMMTDDRHRPWFGEGQMMAKKVAGLPGDVVVVKGDRLYLNGIPYAYLRGETLDRIRRKAPEFVLAFQEPVTIPPGKVLLVNDRIVSFDGRYWGLLDTQQIVGRAFPLR